MNNSIDQRPQSPQLGNTYNTNTNNSPPKPGSAKNPHQLNFNLNNNINNNNSRPESPALRTIMSPSNKNNINSNVGGSRSPTAPSNNNSDRGGIPRPVSAHFAQTVPADINTNSNNNSATFQPGKIRPQTAGGNRKKSFSNFSRQAQFNSGELNLDKLVKRINRKANIANHVEWGERDLQDLING